MKQIVCDRCGAAFEHGSRDITAYAARFGQDLAERSIVSERPDLCTDCAGFVADAFKLALLPVTPEQKARGVSGDPKYGHPTYTDCGCYVTEHPPGNCNAGSMPMTPRVLPKCERNPPGSLCVMPVSCANAGSCQAKSVQEARAVTCEGEGEGEPCVQPGLCASVGGCQRYRVQGAPKGFAPAVRRTWPCSVDNSKCDDPRCRDARNGCYRG